MDGEAKGFNLLFKKQIKTKRKEVTVTSRRRSLIASHQVPCWAGALASLHPGNARMPLLASLGNFNNIVGITLLDVCFLRSRVWAGFEVPFLLKRGLLSFGSWMSVSIYPYQPCSTCRFWWYLFIWGCICLFILSWFCFSLALHYFEYSSIDLWN